MDTHMCIQVGDFGLAARHSGECHMTPCGTPNYIAPECLQRKHGHFFEVDIISMIICNDILPKEVIITVMYASNDVNMSLIA